MMQLLRLSRWQKLHDVAKASLTDDPQNANTHFYLSVALHELDRPKDATQAAERAVSLRPNVARYQANLAQILSYRSKHKDARRIFERALALEPDSLDVRAAYVEAILRDPRANRGRSKAERLEVARSLAKSLKSDAPDDEISHLITAKVYLAEERFHDAQTAAERALAINPNNPVAHQVLGLSYQRRGDRRSAGDAFVAAGKLDPRSSTSRNLLQDLGKGQFALGGVATYVLIHIAMTSIRRSIESGTPVVLVIGVVCVLTVLGFAIVRHRSKTAEAELSYQARTALEASKRH